MAIDVMTRRGGPPVIVGDADDLAELAGFARVGAGIALVFSGGAAVSRRPLSPHAAARLLEARAAIVVHLEGDDVVAAFRVPFEGGDMAELDARQVQAVAEELGSGLFTLEPLDAAPF